jgi:hypothetical protein
MSAQELFYYRLVNLAQNQMSRCQPAEKMLGDLSVRLDAIDRMTARVQIEDEIMKNYAEMTGGHPVTHEHTAKYRLKHSDACEPSDSQYVTIIPLNPFI